MYIPTTRLISLLLRVDQWTRFDKYVEMVGKRFNTIKMFEVMKRRFCIFFELKIKFSVLLFKKLSV